MRNLKRVLAVVLALTLLLTMYLPAAVSAADSYKYTKEATILKNMGLYAGISTTSFNADLGSTVTKEMGVALILRALGYDAYAKALTADQIASMLSIFSDADQISPWARPYVAAGISQGIVSGNLDFTFTPLAPMDAKMMAKLVLVNCDYTIDEVGYQSGPYLLRDYGALTLEQATYFMGKNPIIRDDLVGMMFNCLKLKFKGKTYSIIGQLVSKGLVSEAVALSSGTYNKDIIDAATAAVVAYEAAPYSTPAQVTAGTALKVAAEALIAKFASFPDAASTSVVAIKTALQARIAAQLAKVLSSATFTLVTNEKLRVTVNFSKAIDTASFGDGVTAATTGLYVKVNGVNQPISKSTYLVSNDGKTVTFSFASAANFNDTVSVTATAALKCLDTSTVTQTTVSGVIADSTAPSFATTVGINGKNTLTVTASEPISGITASSDLFNYLDGTQGIKVMYDGAPAIAKISQNTVTGAFTLTFLNEVVKGAHTIIVSGYKDLAGIAGADTTMTFTMDYDSTAPTAVSATYVNTRRVDFLFSEGVIAPAAGFKVNGVVAASTSVSSDGKTVSAILPAAMGAESLYGVTAEVVAGKVSDGWANMAPAASFTVTSNTTDVAAPTATYAYDAAHNQLVITFNEAVQFLTATNLNLMADKVVKGTLAIAAGTYVASSIAVPIADPAVNSMALVLTSDQNVTDCSIKLNTMAKAALTFAFTTVDKAAPSIASAYFNAAKTMLYVSYSEAITNLPATSGITMQEVIVDPLTGPTAYLTTRTFDLFGHPSIVVIDANTIALKADSLANVTGFQIPGTKDLSANVAVGAGSASLLTTFAAPLDVATWGTAVATAKNTFVVTLTGDLRNKIAAIPSFNGIKLLAGGVAANDLVVTNVTVTGSTMTITTSGSINANGTYGASLPVAVQIADQLVATQFGSKIAGATVVASDAIKATQNALTFTAGASISTFSFIFDEAVQKVGATTDAQLAAGIDVYTTVQLLPNIDYTAAIVGGNVVVTLTAPAVVTSAKIARADLLSDCAVVPNTVIVK